MEPVSRSNEDLTGKKKSRFKILKTRLFGRMKRKETEKVMKQSQSASDVTFPERVRDEIDSEDDFLQSEEILGSRALSHDSIFLANQSQSSPQPEQGVSQEATQSKIKSLQTKLQKQKFHLGLPRLPAPGRRSEDRGASSEDDGLPHSPPESSLHEGAHMGTAYKLPDRPWHHRSLSLLGTGSEDEEESSHSLYPDAKTPHPRGSMANAVPVFPPGVDFDTPAQFMPCLDNSAARHRMFIKPKNQRACSRNVLRPRSESLSHMVLPQLEKEEDNDREEVTRFRSYSTVISRAGEGVSASGITKLSPDMNPKPLEGNDTEPKKKVVEDPPLMSSSQKKTEKSNPTNVRVPCAPPQRPEPARTEVPSCATVTPLSVTVDPKDALESVSKPVPVNCPDTSIKSQSSKDSATLNPADSRKRSQSTLDEVPTFTNPVPISETVTLTQEPSPKPKPEDFGALKSSNKRDSINEQVSVLTQVARLEPHTKPQTLTPAGAPKSSSSLDKAIKTSKTSSLKIHIAAVTEVVGQDRSQSEPAQKTTVPSSGQEDKLSVDTPESQQQRQNSGPIRFSFSSAWDRSKTDTSIGREEQAGKKPEDVLARKTSSHIVKERPKEELKTKEQFLNPLSATKTEESLTLKTSTISSTQELPGARVQEAKAKELPQSPMSEQERKNVPKEEDKSTNAMGGEAGGVCGNLGKVTVEEEDEGKKESENERRSMWEESEGDRDRRTAFGVKLRSTSLSLTYRSELARSDFRSKIIKAEICSPTVPLNHQASPLKLPPANLQSSEKQDTISGNSCLVNDDKVKGTSTENIHLSTSTPKKPPCESPDTPTPSSPPKTDSRDREWAGSFKQRDSGVPAKLVSVPPREEEARSEPAWTSMAREKTRGLQHLLTNRLSWEFTTQQPPPQPAPKTTAPPSRLPTLQLTPQEKNNRTVSKERMDRTAEVEGKEPSKAALETWVKSDVTVSQKPISNTRSEMKQEEKSAFKIHTPEAAPCSFPVQHRHRDDRQHTKRGSFSSASSTSSTGQPSWMELAKRKSLAWSDKTMD